MAVSMSEQTANKKDLAQWLSWIEQSHPSEIELGLERLNEVYQRLNLDLSVSKVVIIGGTNGKGSTVAMLDQALRDAGKTVGCFTSPHFLRYNERIKLNGQQAQDDVLVSAFERIYEACGDTSLTYFEYNALAALIVFADAKPDVMLLEVGLGGRLDAINIVDADISVVTTVAVDHIDWLGDDREKIGYEKAGIYRSGRPAVCGDPDAPKMLLDYAAEIGAHLCARGDDFQLTEHADGSWDWQGKSAGGDVVNYRGLPDINLPKPNAAVVIQVLQLLGVSPEEGELAGSLAAATLTGRLQRIERNGCQYTLDVAHNPQAAEYVTSRLNSEPCAGKTWMVLGMLADKDITEVLGHLKDLADQWLLVTLDVPRGQTSAALAEMLQQQGVASDRQTAYDNVAQALEGLAPQLSAGDRVVIAGSFFTVSGALAALELEG